MLGLFSNYNLRSVMHSNAGKKLKGNPSLGSKWWPAWFDSGLQQWWNHNSVSHSIPRICQGQPGHILWLHAFQNPPGPCVPWTVAENPLKIPSPLWQHRFQRSACWRVLASWSLVYRSQTYLDLEQGLSGDGTNIAEAALWPDQA